MCYNKANSSWGLSLFVLFELGVWVIKGVYGSWGLSLFVLFEQMKLNTVGSSVLED